MRIGLCPVTAPAGDKQGPWQGMAAAGPSRAATGRAPEPCAERGTITESWLKMNFSPIKREERFHIPRNHQVKNPAGKEGPEEA